MTRPASSAASGQRHVARRLAEIALRRGFDAVGAGAEIDAVEIEIEDLVLGIFALEPERQDHLLQLALHGALLGQEQVLGELLRDGRAALRHAAMQDIRRGRAGDAEHIDAPMRIEAPVLDRQKRLRQERRGVRATEPPSRPSRRASRARGHSARRSGSRADASALRATGSAAGARRPIRPRRSRRRSTRCPAPATNRRCGRSASGADPWASSCATRCPCRANSGSRRSSFLRFAAMPTRLRIRGGPPARMKLRGAV